jgi:putative ABC transport system substrate-binding protein
LALGCREQPKSVTIGVVNFTSTLNPVYEGFKVGMVEMGYVQGRNVEYIYSGGVGEFADLDPEARDIISKEVDLVLAISTAAALQVKEATAGTGTPVVFAPVVDPVRLGMVNSLSRPGGNLTGIRTGGFPAKQLEWLVTLAPDVKRVLVPHNPDDGASMAGLAALKDGAGKLGVELVVHEARTQEELEPLFSSLPPDIDAILLLQNPLALSRIADFADMAVQHRLPLASTSYAQLEEGALMSYGPDYTEMGRQAARLADKVLNGTKPADLPVETSQYFFHINLRTAEAIGMTIPDSVLQLADRVIR